jgi:hypothetical protein
MNTETRLREYLAEKAETLDVAGRPLNAVATRAGWMRVRAFAVAAVVVLLAVGLPLLVLSIRSESEPAVDEPPPPAGVVELGWSTGVIPADLGGKVIEVADGWLFVPSEGGTPPWSSPDGITWVEQPTPSPFPEGLSLFQIAETDLGYVTTGHTAGPDGDGSRALAIWRSPDLVTWHRVEVFDPLPSPPYEFIELIRVGLLAGSSDRVVLADFVVPEVDFDAIIASLGQDPGSVSAGTSISNREGRVMLRNVENDEIVWQATFDELGFDPELVAQLTGSVPYAVTTWSSSDGGQSWRRGDTFELAFPSGFAATNSHIVLAGRTAGNDAELEMWLSTDGRQWRTADSPAGQWNVAASGDRFLADSLDDQLLTSRDGDRWFPAGDELVAEVSPNGMSLYGGRLGFLLVGFHINEVEDQETATFLFSADGYTWTDTGIRSVLSPPDVGAELVSATVGERSVVVVQRKNDGTLTVHVGTPSE